MRVVFLAIAVLAVLAPASPAVAGLPSPIALDEDQAAPAERAAPPLPHGDGDVEEPAPTPSQPAPPAKPATTAPAKPAAPAARLRVPELRLVPRPAPALVAPPLVVARRDASKEDGRGPEKMPLVAKVKECCGYPVGMKESFRLSFYWLAYESEYANEDYDTDIYTRDGYWIGRYPEAFVFELKLEGSAILRDGRILNYDIECNYGMGTCFKTLALQDHPLGMGAQGRKLVPFRSIAVDPRYIPIGSPVYVPELVGIMMPDGTRHDGCLRADDVGGAIKQHKLDFFVESYFNFKAIGENIWWHLKATPHLEEPRCEYLRLNELRERLNNHTDFAEVHRRRAPMARAEKASSAKVKRNRAIAQAWIKRHRQGTLPPKRPGQATQRPGR